GRFDALKGVDALKDLVGGCIIVVESGFRIDIVDQVGTVRLVTHLWPMLQSELGNRCSFLPREDSGPDALRRTNHRVSRWRRRPANHHIRLWRRRPASHHISVLRLRRQPANYYVLILLILRRRLTSDHYPLKQRQQCRDLDMTGHHNVPPDRY